MNHAPVTRLDLAPKVDRPLSLRNPLDYLRLIYWCLFFPQAVRWYGEHFGQSRRQSNLPPDRSELLQSLRNDPPRRNFIIAAFSILLVFGLLAVVLQAVGIIVTWGWFMLGVLFGLLFGAIVSAVSLDGGVAVGLAVSVVAGFAFTLATNISAGMTSVKIVESVSIGALYGVVGGVLVSVTFGLLVNIRFGLGFAIALSSFVGIFGLLVLAFTAGFSIVAVSSGGATINELAYSAGFTLTFAIVAARVPEWMISILLIMRSEHSVGLPLVYLRLPGLQRRLESWMSQDWSVGVHNINQMFGFSLQFGVAIKAVKNVLEETPENDLLERCAILCDRPYDWDLVLYVFRSLSDDAFGEIIDLLFFVPRRWRQRLKARFAPDTFELRTAAQATCAGFWFWNVGATYDAFEAFHHVIHLPHGLELWTIAGALNDARSMTNLPELASFSEYGELLEMSDSVGLRTGALVALSQLVSVASDAQIAWESVALANRSLALNRANASLTTLLETGASFCPHPEWPLIERIAATWRDVISKAGGQMAAEVQRQPVLNPYDGKSGLPVSGPVFVGRNHIFDQINTRWSGAERLPPLVLYGHRRMGKTSILRNLDQLTDRRTILVYQDMQDSGWVGHTGELLLDLAEALHRRATGAGLDAGAIPVETDYGSLGAARRSLNALLAHLHPQMAGQRLILAIDEFEIIEQGIEDERIDPGLLGYLRSISQEYGWLALIFAGLHTLEEMGHDYRSALYGQAEHIRVGYLHREDAIQLITKPHLDFTLEYEPDLRDEIYRLTYGQPYLLQCLCWELVNRWNERFSAEGETLHRVLTMDDLALVLTADFFDKASYYFDGIWSHVTEPERGLMRVLAGRDEGMWTIAELVAATDQSEQEVDNAVKLLRRHDVIVDEAGGVRFAAELMRRWVAEFQDER